MASSQIYNANSYGAGAVKLRTKTNQLQGKSERSSRVSSMIDLFSNENGSNLTQNQSKSTYNIRNSIAAFSTKEIVERDNAINNNNQSNGRSIPATVRTPKKFTTKTASDNIFLRKNENENKLQDKERAKELLNTVLTSNTSRDKQVNTVKNSALCEAQSRQQLAKKKKGEPTNFIEASSKRETTHVVKFRPQLGDFTQEKSEPTKSVEASPKRETTHIAKFTPQLGDLTQEKSKPTKSLETSPTQQTSRVARNKTEQNNSDISNKINLLYNTNCSGSSNANRTNAASSPVKKNSPLKENSQKSMSSLNIEKEDSLDQKNERKISNARNYWEHKLVLKDGSDVNNQRKTQPCTSDSSLSPRKNFEADSQEHQANERSPEISSVMDKNQKPTVPTRPQSMTPLPRAKPMRPKPFIIKPKSPSFVHDVPPSPKQRNFNERRPISPLVQSPSALPHMKNDAVIEINRPAESKRIPVLFDKDRRQGGTSDPNKNNPPVVNPIPKPQRTFTFAAADAGSPRAPPVRLHKNVIRVSSDLSTINGPGFESNLRNAFLNSELCNSTPNVSTRAPNESYEEVVFSKVQETDRCSTGPSNMMKSWRRQHNYEDVVEIENDIINNGPVPGNYDHISIDLSKPFRHRSFSELDSDNYSRLTFQQDLLVAEQNKSSSTASSPSSAQHMKLKKQMSELNLQLSRNNSITKSEKSMESGMKLQITDKIREAFTQISRKYKHHRKQSDDIKSLSSSGDEDSDTEMDFNKHRLTLDRTKTMQKTYRNTLKYKSLERELAGFEKSSLFEQVLICKIMTDQSGTSSSKVSYRFPAPPPGKNIGDEKTLAHFCFPDIEAIDKMEEMPSQSYAFMLTREDGSRKFGYCRRILPPGDEPRYPVVYCLISPLGSFGLYETILDELECRHRISIKKISIFLESLQTMNFPAPGRSIRVDVDEIDNSSYFMLRRPFDTRLEHVDLRCLLTELGVDNTIKIFTSLLLERRVIICGKSLGILTACIHAIRALLYPFVWQHVFVPVLPPPMVDLCCSPTPLLIGILETSVEKLMTLPLEEVLIVNVTNQEVISSAGDEMEILPRKLQTPLINSLNSHTTSSMQGISAEPNYDFAMDYESAERNTVISESFMHLFVEMIGHYQSHFQTNAQTNSPAFSRIGQTLRTFNKVSFYDDVTSRSLKRFLDLFMGTQMFDGFIHSRELASTDYEGLFERRIARHLSTADASHLNFKVFRTKMKRFMQGIGKKKI